MAENCPQVEARTRELFWVTEFDLDSEDNPERFSQENGRGHVAWLPCWFGGKSRLGSGKL